MKRHLLLTAPFMLAAIMAPSAHAAEQSTATAGTLEPDAAEALDRMGAFLRTLKSFEITVDATRESVLDDGQKLQFLSKTRYVFTGPNKLYAETKSDREARKYYYDGTNFTIFNPTTGYYAQAPATGTVNSFLSDLYKKYGIEFPVQDLFRWGDASAVSERPREGTAVGPALIGNWLTTHYAFRQTGTDFQVWIDDGDKPFPRKIVITDLEDPARPQYVAYLRWETENPRINATNFSFVPGPNAKRIPLQPAAATEASKK